MKYSLFILTDWFWPAYKAGGPIQSLLNLTNQFKYHHAVNVVCGNKDLGGTDLDVVTDKWIKASEVNIFYSSRGVGKALSEIDCATGKPIFFINGIYSPRFNFQPALFGKHRKIVSVRGMLHPEALMQKKIKKSLYLKVWKLLALHKRCEYHATSDLEKKHIQTVFGQKCKVWVIPNLPNRLSFTPAMHKTPGALILCTIALISRMKNHKLVLEALMHIQEQVTYHIYGPIKDEAYWEECLELMRLLPDNIQVKYQGTIYPQDVPAALAKCHVFIQPSESENFGHSLYEALTSGRPVITSFSTPWTGLEDGEAGVNVSTDNGSHISSAIRFFIEMDQAQLNKWSLMAREYASHAVNIEDSICKYSEMFFGSSQHMNRNPILTTQNNLAASR